MNNQVSGEEQVEIQKSRELEGIPLFCNVLYLDTEGIFHKNLCCEESKRIQRHSTEGLGSLKVAAVVQGCAGRCYPCQVWQSGTVIPLHQRGAQLCSVISFTMRLYFIFYAIFYIMFVAPKLNCTIDHGKLRECGYYRQVCNSYHRDVPQSPGDHVCKVSGPIKHFSVLSLGSWHFL